MVNRSRERTSWTGPAVRFAPPLTRLAPIDVPAGADNIMSYRGILYVSASGNPNMITAIDPISQAILWSDSIPGSVGGNEVTPAADDRNVYFGGQQGSGLFAFDRITGARRWSKPIGSLYARCPVVDGQYLYIIHDTLWCLDASTGNTIWRREMYATASPVLDETAVYVSGNDTIAAFDKLTGNTRWTVGKATRSYGSLTVDANNLYASFTDTIAAFRKSDGSVQWKHSLEHRLISRLAQNAIAITDSVLCYCYESDASGNGGVVALDIRTGLSLWSHPFSMPGGISPIIVDGVVYFSTDWTYGQLRGLSVRSGAVVFQDSVFEYAYQPIFADGVLYVSTRGSIVRFISTSTGISPGAPPPDAILEISTAPNPFTGVSTIRISAPIPVTVRVSVIDGLGRSVATLHDGRIECELRLLWDGRDTAGNPLPSAVYRVVASCDNGMKHAGMVLLRR